MSTSFVKCPSPGCGVMYEYYSQHTGNQDVCPKCRVALRKLKMPEKPKPKKK